MSVKVSKIKDLTPPKKTYLKFDWECTKCGGTTHDEVLENILFQYKKRNMGPMLAKKICHECKTHHSMELRL